MKWNEADSFCKQKGRALASLALPGEAEWVIGEANRIFDSTIYKSFSVNARTRVLGVKEEFYWVTASSIGINDELWYHNEPNNLGGKEECLEIAYYGPSSLNNNYLFNDIPCDYSTTHVLCEGL